MDFVLITDQSSRADIERAIAALRLKQNRLPSHYADQREAIALELELLVEQWLATPK